MPRARTPTSKAKVTGATVKNPQRFKGRGKGTKGKLGATSSFLSVAGQAAWEAFKKELPWLTEGHRAILEVCAMVRGDLIAGAPVGVSRLQMYQSMLSKLGATPADESKIRISEDDEEEKDDIFDA